MRDHLTPGAVEGIVLQGHIEERMSRWPWIFEAAVPV
jgi:hypothetical protein